MTPVNILYFDEANPSADSLHQALSLIAATSGGAFKATACTPDSLITHLKTDLTGIGFDHLYHKRDPIAYAMYICGADFPLDAVHQLDPYFSKYNIQLHITQ